MNINKCFIQKIYLNNTMKNRLNQKIIFVNVCSQKQSSEIFLTCRQLQFDVPVKFFKLS